jgi:hypothetical protein
MTFPETTGALSGEASSLPPDEAGVSRVCPSPTLLVHEDAVISASAIRRAIDIEPLTGRGA